MLLQVKNIDVSYDEFQVIWDVSISIDQGEMVALLGPNGSGKSTILNSISNLIQPKYGYISERKYILREVIRLKDLNIEFQNENHMINLKSAFIPNTRKVLVAPALPLPCFLTS